MRKMGWIVFLAALGCADGFTPPDCPDGGEFDVVEAAPEAWEYVYPQDGPAATTHNPDWTIPPVYEGGVRGQ